MFNVTIALMLMELGIFKMLEHILGLYSIVAVAWVGALVADLAINKPQGLSPAGIEFKRAYLYDTNPVGVGAMLIAAIAGIVAFFGVLGTTLQSLSAFLALAVASCATPRSHIPRYTDGALKRKGVVHRVEKGQTLWRIILLVAKARSYRARITGDVAHLDC